MALINWGTATSFRRGVFGSTAQSPCSRLKSIWQMISWLAKKKDKIEKYIFVSWTFFRENKSLKFHQKRVCHVFECQNNLLTLFTHLFFYFCCDVSLFQINEISPLPIDYDYLPLSERENKPQLVVPSNRWPGLFMIILHFICLFNKF